MSEPIKCFFVEDTGQYGPVQQLPSGGTRQSPILRRTDTGEEFAKGYAELPIGAMWYGSWYPEGWCNPQLGEGKALIVKTPGGDWLVDQQARNCTMPDDLHQEKHHCWIIHGTPPEITVDKDGVTCNAGAGSIQQGTWHGFLKNGYLVE
jgi:hypothetical protein